MNNRFVQCKQVGHRVVVRFSGIPSCERDIDEYFSFMEDVYARDQPFLALFDISQVGFIPLSDAKRQAAFMREKDEITRRIMKRAAIVSTGVITRSVLNVIFAIKKPACDICVFDTLDRAQQYLRDCPYTFIDHD
jgi:hypothetical protein